MHYHKYEIAFLDTVIYRNSVNRLKSGYIKKKQIEILIWTFFSFHLIDLKNNIPYSHIGYNGTVLIILISSMRQISLLIGLNMEIILKKFEGHY